MHVSIISEEPSPSEGLPRHVQDQIGRRLDELIPSASAVDTDTRLGRVLLRLRAALLDAEAERQITKAFGDDLIALVPRLRRFALLRTGNTAEADAYEKRIMSNHDAEVEEDLPPRTAAILRRRRWLPPAA